MRPGFQFTPVLPTLVLSTVHVLIIERVYARHCVYVYDSLAKQDQYWIHIVHCSSSSENTQSGVHCEISQAK